LRASPRANLSTQPTSGDILSRTSLEPILHQLPLGNKDICNLHPRGIRTTCPHCWEAKPPYGVAWT
jgi:hypothetical protein